ncbi:hypothetical protein C493_10458 [Natronolimnohabitans innermongolicus JCM 12255]|uniref:Uncharacterized protein n=1 Tax=Natronolimnohabitans innermongolicus JCM 12255 TaxID=1227499 RepID=L9X5M6_9EURY|nr:hypothetical protein C493_10458 [Natronolimnohabitans innermongolicus JCM 12255]
MNRNESQRTIVICADCGSICAGNVTPDGTVRSIGRPDGCDCGSREFVLPTDSSVG